MKLFFFFLFTFLPLVFAFSTFADEFTGFENPIGSSDFFGVIDGVLDFLFPFGVAIAVIMVFVGAFQWLTAGGDTKKIIAGRGTLLWVAVGIAVLAFARVIVAAVQEFFQ